ncbi:HEXXH motif-containing putative peptide modification protein [Umezawaea endophytica]|uniref:HEXXH motif-containing putative peptide modification protein n=1 Tax=Umezawaea endophytica TaxID=1654476 RepID=A0A9X3AEM9_9PSEU|nr:HEXXH motif-containing putative peptide modification protein [Umezawaea endophytica]MCS7477482.1 HEXXH motif-containing putative peptide modification protein [Umezawaea endophytica]
MNTRHAVAVVDRLRARLDLPDTGSWSDDHLTAFLRYEDDPAVHRGLREAVYRRRLALVADLLPAHLDAAAPIVRHDVLTLLDLLADAPRTLLQDVLSQPGVEPWLTGHPTEISAAGLGGLLAAAQSGRTEPVVPWSGVVAPLHLGRLVVDGAIGTVAVAEDGTTRITTGGGTVEFDPLLMLRETPRPMISGTTLSFVLPQTRHSGFVLDGFDTRLADGPLPIERLSSGLPRARRWVEVVDSGSCLLSFLDPAAGNQVDRTLRILIPHHQPDGRKFGLPEREMVSSTAEATVGAFGISLGDENPLRIAEALVREHARTRLRTLLWERPMHGPDRRRYDTPWRRDPGHISDLVPGIAAFTLVSAFYRTVRTTVLTHRWSPDRLGTEAPGEADLSRATARATAEVLHGIGQALAADELLPFGRRFLSMAREVVSESR